MQFKTRWTELQAKHFSVIVDVINDEWLMIKESNLWASYSRLHLRIIMMEVLTWWQLQPSTNDKPSEKFKV